MPANGRQENRPARLRKFYGDLPTYAKGVNKGRLRRTDIAKMYMLSGGQLTKAYLNWQDVFRIPGSTLTFREYLDKLRNSRLTPDHIGNVSNGFNLARVGDVGPYTDRNCRFIPRSENIAEQRNLFGRRARI